MRKFILRNKLVIVVCILILAFGLGWWIWAAVPTQTTIGDDIIVSGNIGIGTTSPSAKLHVGDVSGSTIGFIVDSRMKTDGSEAGLWIEADSTDWFIGRSGTNLRFWAGADKVTMTQAGNIGIGTTNPAEKLHVNGRIRLGTGPSNSMDAATKQYVDGKYLSCTRAYSTDSGVDKTSVTCPSGYKLTGGGCQAYTDGVAVTGQYPADAQTMWCYFTAPGLCRALAVCCKVY